MFSKKRSCWFYFKRANHAQFVRFRKVYYLFLKSFWVQSLNYLITKLALNAQAVFKKSSNNRKHESILAIAGFCWL